MSNYDAARILKGDFFDIKPLVANRGARSRHIVGFDTEAERGRPFMLQFNDHGDESATEIMDLPENEPNAALRYFTSWVYKKCQAKEVEYLIFGWNLAYEWTQLFGDIPREIACEDEYHIVYGLLDDNGELVARYNIRVFNSKRYSAVWTRLGLECIESCTVDNHRCGSKRRIRLVDGMAFYVTGLDKAGEMLGLGRKVAKPMRFTREAAQSDHFREYARQDAYLTRRIGEQIVSMHEDFNVTQCISAPHFASKVYKRAFLDDEIKLPSIDLEQAGLWSYHGGKNGYYLDGPRHLTDVYSYDITSAYPEAMRAIPDPVRATFEFREKYRRNVHALWRVSGTLKPCRYGCLYDHGGQIRRGREAIREITDVWLTSYELDSMLAQDEIDLTDCQGFEMRGPSGGSLSDYVDRFFEMKRTTTGAARAVAKLFLNSLYGKFFQKQPLGNVGYHDLDSGEVQYIATNPDQQFDWQAGGLYHPPIASLITGFVRGKIHRLEHKYDAITTSTDGFFAMRPPDAADIGKTLGALTVERGDLMIWRERLYSFTPAKGGEGKFALHGFRGTVDELRKVPLTVGSYSYKAQQMVTLRLSRHKLGADDRQYSPGEFALLDFRLDLTTANAPP